MALADFDSSRASSDGGGGITPPAETSRPAVESARTDSSARRSEVRVETGPAAKDAMPREATAPLNIDELTFPGRASRDAAEAKAFVDILNNNKFSAKERGQGLLDLHKQDIARVSQEATRQQSKAWDDQNRSWRDELKNDREIGGSGLHANLSKAKTMIEQLLSRKEAAAFLKHVDANGMGNYPPMVRLLVRLADRFKAGEDALAGDSAAASDPAPEPPPAKPQRAPSSRRWYDRSID